MTKQLKTIEILKSIKIRHMLNVGGILNPPKSSNTGGWILMDSGLRNKKCFSLFILLTLTP